MNSRQILEKDSSLTFPHALLISASAGSGKTYTLTQRYIQFLLSDKVPNNDLSGILAVTFTNNAAKEMKVRILGWLKALALDKNCEKMDETLALVSLGRDEVHKRARDLVERVINDYSDFHIQTIDSFLARVMTASADELKLPLKPEIRMSYDILIDLALYSMFARIGKADLPAETVDKFLAVLPKTDSYPWDPVRRVKENFDDFLTQEGKTSGLIKNYAGDYEGPLKTRFAAVVKHCAAAVKHYKDRTFFKEKILAVLEDGNLTGFLAAYKFDYGIFSGARRSKLPAGWEKDRDLLNEQVIELAELNAAAYYHPYVGIYDRFKAELERVKRGKTDVIHINDIAKKLAAYINEKNVPEIYLKLGERITHFLLDEFQDTNRLQWDVIRPLVEESISKTGSLFVVGDIKQAIFMFRNADYKIMRGFLDAAERRAPGTDYLSLETLDGGLKYVNLPMNYRSDGEVLNYVNELFKKKLKDSPELIGGDITGLTSYEQHIQPGRAKAGYVKTSVLELEDPAEPGEQKKWLLAAVNGARQRYPLGEIAILVEKNKRIGAVVEWLTEAGIPVASFSSLDIRKRKVIAELIAYLKFLETPSDDLSFAELIAGDIFTRATGLKRSEMLDFIFSCRASSGARGSGALLYSAFRNHPEYREYWDKHLDGAFRKVGYLPLYDLVSLIYAELAVFSNFPEEAAFLSRFLNAVVSLEPEGVFGARSFVEYASGSDEDKSKVFAIALPEYMDAVRVMTFHKSKGLGFSVVINLLYEERGNNTPMYFEEKDGETHVYHITKAAAEQSVKLRPVYESRKTDDNVQDLNVLYVISTRARHELYNLVIKKARKTEAKEPKLLDLFETYESGAFSAHKPGHPRSMKPVEIGSPAGRAERSFDAAKPTYGSFFATAEGELTHKLLSRIDILPAPAVRGPETLKSELEKHYDAFAPGFPFEFDKAKLIGGLADFLSAPGAAPLFSAAPDRIILREAEFIDKNGSLFRMDRVIIDKASTTVVDFKTGLENTEKHKAQMKNYLAIISEVYNKPAKGVLAYVDQIRICNVLMEG